MYNLCFLQKLDYDFSRTLQLSSTFYAPGNARNWYLGFPDQIFNLATITEAKGRMERVPNWAVVVILFLCIYLFIYLGCTGS